MILFKKILQFIVALCICSFTFSAVAIDQAAKEEISPPSDDGPLAAEKLPPINSVANPPSSVEPQKVPAGLPAQPDKPANQAAPVPQ